MDTQAAGGIAQPSQCIHVQLQGGAPWGFTLKGGLEHGEPLIISKIEDGGKAAKCEKMEVGDELVNINGTPLYGSRQEALILIKGSYKILKMIVRRRNISVVRPHSWHLAKLSEVRPDVASMQYPADSFSMSWHSGCETSELPMQWNPLSRHCSTDKSSSIGSMESLDQPGQTYYEGTLSPIDPGMYQNKRDSAYSSFSASSNTSDYTVSARIDQSSPVNCILGLSKQEDGRYLQTGQSAVDPLEDVSMQTLVEHPQRPSSFPFETNHLDIIKSPPQPPVRRDSLRASKNQLCQSERRRASAPGDTFHISGRWSSDALHINNTDRGQCLCRRGHCTLHLKENLSSDQYYMLSSQTAHNHQSTDQSTMGDEGQLDHCSKVKSRWPIGDGKIGVFNNSDLDEVTCYTVEKVKETFKKSLCNDPKAPHNHSHQSETFSVKSVFRNELEMASSADSHYPTDKCSEENGKDHKCSISKHLETSQSDKQNIERFSQTNDGIIPAHHCPSLDRLNSKPNEVREAQCTQTDDYAGGLGTETLLEGRVASEISLGPTKKPGTSRHRSAQMRRKSDRFATNLRNEIQRRKAQLQKSKGPSVLLCGEEPVEKEEAVECQSRPGPPPPPPPKNKARLLEIKRANAELCTNPTDCSYQARKGSKIIDKMNGTPNYNREEIIKFMNKTSQENEEITLKCRNKAHNDCRKTYTTDIHQQVYETKQVGIQKDTELTFAHSKRDTQPTTNMIPKPDNCRNEWRISSLSKPNSPEMWVCETGNETESLKCIEEQRYLSDPDAKISSDDWSTDLSQNTCNIESPTEGLGKNISEYNNCSLNYPSFGSEVKLNGMQLSREQPVTEQSTSEKWKLNHLENKGQEQRVQEQRPNEVAKSDGFSSVCAMQRKPSHQPSDFENIISQHNPHGAKWTWSPEHKLQPHLSRRGSSEVNGMKIGVAPPITCVTEENVLMPFADRRRFFEDTSKDPPSQLFMHSKANKNNFCPNLPDYPLPPAMVPDLRRHSVDHTYHHASSPSRQESGLPFSEYCMNHAMDPPLCCNQSSHSTDYHHSVAYGCRACMFCCNDLCPTFLKRNIPVTHHSCHCQHHHHHHHQWTRCSDYLCPSQHNPLDEGTSIHSDPWHLRKILPQDVPLKELNQQLKINRKYSQSVSELCPYNYNSGFHHNGHFRSRGEVNDQEWPQSYKAASTYDLSGDHPLRPIDMTSFQEGPPEPGLSRGRAYSVSQLNLEFLALRDRRDPPMAKLEEREAPAPPKKKGPPRPPPPKWEKCRERRASHQATKSGPSCCKGKSEPGHNIIVEDARQRSQSLPMERTFLNVAHNSSPSSVHGTDHSMELSEMRCTSQGSRSLSSSASPCQETLIDCGRSPSDTSPARKLVHALPTSSVTGSEAAVPVDHAFCPQAPIIEQMSADIHEQEQPPALMDIFEGGYRRYEDDWSTDRESEISIPDRYEFQPISPPPVCGAVSPTSCATYYNTSAAKAELLNKMKEMPGVQEELGSTPGADEEDKELTFKKMQLIESISRKLSVLHEAQQDLHEDMNANATLGCDLENLLKNLCKPNEYDKFRTFIGDLDKVVNLLLSLSGRLSRVESALCCEDPEPSMEEKLNLLEKKKQLTDQLEDAKELKAHVTWREQVVLEAVSKYLNEEQLQDYHHYVKMTSALIVEQRELEDKIRLGEEQLRCLRESL